MNPPELDPLAPELAALFAEEARAYDGDAALLGEVRRRVELGVALRGGNPGGGGDGAGGAEGPGGPTSGGGDATGGASGAPLPGSAAPSTTSAASVAGAVRRALAIGAVSGLATGGALGVVGARAMGENASVSTSEVAPAKAVESIATPAAEAAPPTAIEVGDLPSLEPRPPARTLVPTREGTERRPRSDLRRERELVDAARAAVAASRAGESLELLDRHAKAFPNGQLAEDRDALRVQALVTADRRGEAEVLAQAFRRRHPTSPLLPVIDAALAR